MSGRYCVVIPAFNVAETVGGLVQTITRLGLTAVVVNDGSRDETAAIAAKLGAVVISHLRNEGKGCALQTGFRYALRSNFDGVVTIDGDGQHDPAEIPRLIRAGEHQHAGIVIGNRMEGPGRMPLIRRWTNRTMSMLVSRLSRQQIPDSQSGFRFIRKEVLSSLSLKAAHFELETELLLLASLQRWKTVSIPVQTIYRDQSSHIRPVRDTARFARVIVRYLLRQLDARRGRPTRSPGGSPSGGSPDGVSGHA